MVSLILSISNWLRRNFLGCGLSWGSAFALSLPWTPPEPNVVSENLFPPFEDAFYFYFQTFFEPWKKNMTYLAAHVRSYVKRIVGFIWHVVLDGNFTGYWDNWRGSLFYPKISSYKFKLLSSLISFQRNVVKGHRWWQNHLLDVHKITNMTLGRYGTTGKRNY